MNILKIRSLMKIIKYNKYPKKDKNVLSACSYLKLNANTKLYLLLIKKLVFIQYYLHIQKYYH